MLYNNLIIQLLESDFSFYYRSYCGFWEISPEEESWDCSLSPWRSSHSSWRSGMSLANTHGLTFIKDTYRRLDEFEGVWVHFSWVPAHQDISGSEEIRLQNMLLRNRRWTTLWASYGLLLGEWRRWLRRSAKKIKRNWQGDVIHLLFPSVTLKEGASLISVWIKSCEVSVHQQKMLGQTDSARLMMEGNHRPPVLDALVVCGRYTVRWCDSQSRRRTQENYHVVVRWTWSLRLGLSKKWQVPKK